MQSVSSFDDLASARRLAGLVVVSGAAGLFGDDQVSVRRTVAVKNHWAVGDQVEALFARGGARQLTIGSIFDGAPVAGSILVPAQTANASFRGTQPSVALVKLRGADNGDAAKIDDLLQASPEVQKYTVDGWIDSIDVVFEFAQTSMDVLLAISLTVALLGIINTLMLSIHERRRELALLQLLSMPAREVIWMIVSESMSISAFGALIGAGLGTLIGWLAVGMLQGDGLSATIPWATVAVYVVVATIAGAASAAFPASKAVLAVRTGVMAVD